MAIETPAFVQEQLMDSDIKGCRINRELLRRYIEAYRIYVKYEGEEPITVTLHECRQWYAEPEGIYKEVGISIKTIFVFSKKQAIRDAIYLHLNAEEEYGDSIDELGWKRWDVNFSSDYGRNYCY